MRLYLLHYNNYYNRKLKVLTSLSSYITYAVSNTVPYVTETNFNPNDGIMTEQIIGSGSVPWTYGDPDYIVAANDNGTQIVSRWYVLEAIRLRYGQYKLRLRRDVLADYKNIIMTAPAMIAKGMLSISDDGIFNPEAMNFSQVKKSETLLAQTATEQGWIVAYMTPPNTAQTLSWPVDSGINAPSYTSLSDIPNYANSKIIPLSGSIITGTYKTVQYGAQAFGVNWKNVDTVQSQTYNYKTTVYSQSDFETETILSTPALYVTDEPGEDYEIAGAVGPNVASMQGSLQNDIQTSIAAFLNSVGNYYEVGTTIYKVTGYTVKSKSNQTTQLTSAGFPTLFTAMTSYAAAAGLSGTPNNNSFYMYGDITEAMLIVEEQQSATRTITIPTTIRQLSDAPYAMFCMPLSGRYLINGQDYLTNPDQSLKTVMEIAKGLTSDVCFEVQILPYCPRQDFIDGYGIFELAGTGSGNNGVEDEDYVLIKEGGTTVGAITFCNSSSFQFSIKNSSIVSLSSDPIQFKVDSLTRFCRICSPNYNGQFEFTPEKNGGLSYFDIFCTYKPYNPYIQVAPRFNRLYGVSFADARGLICAGDWSIPQTSSAWESFELSNKNYQQSFDREVQSIELRNDRQKLMDVAAAITGTVSGGMTGAATGMTVGGPYAAIAGAIVGTAGSAAMGGMDVQIAEELRKDALSLKKDLFTFQMQNIRAMPQSLTRVGAITKVFKVFPFVEVFDAPQVEKQALYNKIKYNGMTVMRIGNIQDYLGTSPSYVQGRFIWLDGLDEDYHIAQAITDEFEKGVYI